MKTGRPKFKDKKDLRIHQICFAVSDNETAYIEKQMKDISFKGNIHDFVRLQMGLRTKKQ